MNKNCGSAFSIIVRVFKFKCSFTYHLIYINSGLHKRSLIQFRSISIICCSGNLNCALRFLTEINFRILSSIYRNLLILIQCLHKKILILCRLLTIFAGFQTYNAFSKLSYLYCIRFFTVIWKCSKESHNLCLSHDFTFLYFGAITCIIINAANFAKFFN